MGKYDSYLNEQGIRISKATGKPVAKYTKRNKQYWAERMGEAPKAEAAQTVEIAVDPLIAKLQSLYTEEEIKGIIGLKEDKGTFELVNIVEKTNSSIDDGINCVESTENPLVLLLFFPKKKS